MTKNEPIFSLSCPCFNDTHHHCTEICSTAGPSMMLRCSWSHWAVGLRSVSEARLPFLKLFRHIFFHGEFNIWEVSFCNCQMFFCYLLGRQIIFIFFVCMLHTHTHTHPSSHLAAKQRTSFLWFSSPLPVNADQAWQIFSQRSNSSQSCDANEDEVVVMTYTCTHLFAGGPRGKRRSGRKPPARYSHLHNLSSLPVASGLIHHPSSGEDESICFLPRDAVGSAWENPLCVGVWSEFL